jgi:hypothetical protein
MHSINRRKMLALALHTGTAAAALTMLPTMAGRRRWGRQRPGPRPLTTSPRDSLRRLGSWSSDLGAAADGFVRGEEVDGCARGVNRSVARRACAAPADRDARPFSGGVERGLRRQQAAQICIRSGRRPELSGGLRSVRKGSPGRE